MAYYQPGQEGYNTQQQQYAPPPQQNYYAPPPPPPLHPQQQGYYGQQQPPPQENPYYAPPAYGSPQAHHPSQTSGPPPAPPGDYSGGYEKFSAKPRINDLWAAILFGVHIAGFIVLAAFAVPKGFSSDISIVPTTTTSGNNDDALIQLIVMMVVAAVISFIISIVYLLAMQRWAAPMIKITFVISILLYFVMAALFILLKSYISALIMVIFGLVNAYLFWAWRSRIPFAALMLETVCSVTRKYTGTMGVAAGGLLLQMAWTFLWLLTVTGAIAMVGGSNCRTIVRNGRSVRQCDGNSSSGALTWVVAVFCLFSFYWTSQVLKNVVHVTVCGVFGTFYFLEGTAQMPSGSATLGGLKRAVTSAFGSICYGSLIIAIIQTTRAILRALAESNDGIMAFVACFFACILAYIEALVEYFNLYAFAQVAIYGKPFCQAGRDTWTMIKDRGVEAIINDNLIGNVLGVGMLLVGIITGAIGYIYLLVKNSSFIDANQGYTAIAVIACFLIGLLMMSLVTGVIDSGVVSTFVALAEDPMALARTKPVLFERIRQTWPDVVVGVQ